MKREKWVASSEQLQLLQLHQSIHIHKRVYRDYVYYSYDYYGCCFLSFILSYFFLHFTVFVSLGCLCLVHFYWPYSIRLFWLNCVCIYSEFLSMNLKDIFECIRWWEWAMVKMVSFIFMCGIIPKIVITDCGF